MKNTNTTKTTVLCKTLIYNADFTTKFVGKSTVGEEVFKQWTTSLKHLNQVAFDYYVSVVNNVNNEELQKPFEDVVYKVLREEVFALIGKVPNCTEELTSSINAKKLFIDVVSACVKRDGKNEVEKLVKARAEKQAINKEYRQNCFNSDGYPLTGLTEDYVKSYTDKLAKAQAKIEKLLEVKGNSIYADIKAKDNAFIKAFEIAICKEVKRLNTLTVAEVKAEKQAKDKARQTNRAKTNK